MKLSKKVVLAALVLPLTFGALTANAKGHRGHGGQCGDFNLKMLRQLDLTDEQVTEIKALKKEAKEAMKSYIADNKDDIKAQKESQRADVKALLLADSFDEQKAREIAVNKADNHVERGVKKMELFHKMIQVLNDEQKAELVELQAEKLERCQNKRKSRNDF